MDFMKTYNLLGWEVWYSILIKFDITMKHIRLIKMLLNENHI